jgi:heterotetrameric sarcosine oxidase delta subunit
VFLIRCPYCGERDQSDFTPAGEAHIERPAWRDKMTDQQWADFVFMRKNTKGIFAERWNHSAGCRKFFNMLRNTVTDEIIGVYEIGAKPPTSSSQLPATPSGEAIGSGNDAVKVAPAAGKPSKGRKQ